MPNWAWFLAGIITVHVVYALVALVIWFEVILRQEDKYPGIIAEIDPDVDMIRRDIGTLTYSRRN